MARVRTAGILFVLLVPTALAAQVAAPATPSVDSTVEEIQRLRRQKLENLRPESLSWLHRTILNVRESRLPQKLTYGFKGVRPRFGTLGPGSGFGVGVEYFRPNLRNERFTVRTSVTASPLQFFMMDGEFEARRLGGRGFLNALAFHRFSPAIDFYGVGNASALTNLTAYSLEENSLQLTGGWQWSPRLRTAGFGQFYKANAGSTRAAARVSTERLFRGPELPGFGEDSAYIETGAFIDLGQDGRLGAPPGGTRAFARASRFQAQRGAAVNFTRVEAFAERNQLFLNQQRAFVLRGRAVLNKPQGQDTIPFYLQPQLGGPNDLRGYAGRRFYDNNLASASAEYQWQILSGVWLAAFTDAGKVFPQWDRWSLEGVRTSYGAGLRFGSPGLGTGRFDFAFSREGTHFWIVFATF